MFQKLKFFVIFCFSAASIVLIFLIRSETSKNYFNEQLTQEEKNKFFYNPGTNPLIQPSEIGIKCQMLQNTIMDEKVTKLGDVFELNIEIIHEKTGALIGIWFTSIISIIFFNNSLYRALRSQSVYFICLSFCFIIIDFILPILNYYFLYKLILAFNYNDMNQFIQFLKCENVVREGFSKYLYVEKLHYYIAFFIICSMVDIGFKLCGNNNNTNENRIQRNNNGIELNS